MKNSTGHILVATDSLIQRRILVDVLNDIGCNVNIASSGDDVVATALQEVSNHSPFDVIILDMQMGGMESIHALKSLRAEEQTKDVKVLLLISQEQERTVTGLDNLGYAGYLVKPIWREHLNQMLNQVCDTNTQLADASAVAPIDILVADDDELNHQMLKILLEKKGYKVQAVSDGTDALEAFMSWRFGLAIVDVHMPTMGGYELTERIREWEAGRTRLPIITLTASATPDEISQFEQVGMDAYLPKPLDQKTLFELIDQYTKSQEQSFVNAAGDARNFNAIETLKHQSALPRFGNDVEQYKQLLAQFVMNFPDRITKVQAAIQNSDWAGASDLAHNLKGVSANLGALKLSVLAKDLEYQLGRHDEQVANQILVDIMEEVKKLSSIIKNVFGLDTTI